MNFERKRKAEFLSLALALATANLLQPVFAQEGPDMSFQAPLAGEGFVIELPEIGEMPAPPDLPPDMLGMALGAPPPFGMPMPAMAPMMMGRKGGGGCDMLRGGSCGMLAGVDWTDEQMEQIWKSKQTMVEKGGLKMAELVNQKMQLKDLLSQPQLDKAKIQGTQNKINSLMGDLANLRLEQELATLSLLSPEQHKEMRRKFVEKAAGLGSWGKHKWKSKYSEKKSCDVAK